MSTGFPRATKILTTLAFAALGALAIGCGPAPGYEPQPRVPIGYSPARSDAEPLSSDELAAQNEARAQAAGEVAVGEETDEYSDTDPSALTEFKPALEGHGEWVDDTTYGTVWVPSEEEVGADFVPYTTAGHWSYDDATSWVWVSDYSWGWAPFHYGRWVHASRHGWAWIPGRTYAGAWVTWRIGSGYDYIGWAPMGPSWFWYGGTAVGWNYGYTPYYSYCPRQYIYSPAVVHHVVRGPAAREQEEHTRPYVAAAPAVAGGGRVAASPTVGGGRVGASPTVGERALANPRIGPRPSELGIPAAAVVAPPREDAGLARARVFANPRTAVSQGAAPPVGARSRPNSDAFTTARPAYRGPASSSYEAAARAPQYRGVTPTPPRQAALPELRPTPRTFSPAPGLGPSGPAAPSVASRPPSFRSQPSIAATPTYRTPSPPTYRSPSFSSPSPSVRSMPSPSVRSMPSPSVRSMPSPSIRSAPSAPAFRSSPRVASPSVRSAPAPRVSTPSRSSGAAIRSRR